jgi:hypothetical protein
MKKFTPKHSTKLSLTSKNKDIKKVLNYLKIHTATATMVCEFTGIKQKNFCRYKRELEKLGLLFEVKKGICEITKFRASYLTTNPDLISKIK